MGFPCGSAGKESTCDVGDLALIPGLGRLPGEGKGYPLQYSGLENSMDCIVHGVAKSRTQLSDFHFHFHLFITIKNFFEGRGGVFFFFQAFIFWKKFVSPLDKPRSKAAILLENSECDFLTQQLSKYDLNQQYQQYLELVRNVNSQALSQTS